MLSLAAGSSSDPGQWVRVWAPPRGTPQRQEQREAPGISPPGRAEGEGARALGEDRTSSILWCPQGLPGIIIIF